MLRSVLCILHQGASKNHKLFKQQIWSYIMCIMFDKQIPLFLTKYKPILSKLQYVSAANPKLFSFIHNLTSNFISATMHAELHQIYY